MAKRRKKRFRWLRFLLKLVLLAALAVALFVGYKFTQIRKGSPIEENQVKNESIDAEELRSMNGYTDLALFGVDSREGVLESGANSDTIIVCSIQKRTHEVRLVSVYRDTYLDLTDGSYSKCNAAYAVGGAQQAISMLNKNLDLNITDYVTVNFAALVKLVDLFGGVDITLTEGEVQLLNGYLVEGRQVLGIDTEDVPGPGQQHLNGMQALAYSRIRYIGLDYERTQRQREVLSQVLEKAKASDLLTVNEAIDTLLPMISTSLSAAELAVLALGVRDYVIAETEGFPFDKTTADLMAGDCVVPLNLAANVTRLHSFLYGTENYVPSPTVQEISDTISYETGLY